MGVDRFNSEGYYDPTAFEALKRVKFSWLLCKSCVFKATCAFAGMEIGACGSYKEEGTGHEDSSSGR